MCMLKICSWFGMCAIRQLLRSLQPSVARCGATGKELKKIKKNTRLYSEVHPVVLLSMKTHLIEMLISVV